MPDDFNIRFFLINFTEKFPGVITTAIINKNQLIIER